MVGPAPGSQAVSGHPDFEVLHLPPGLVLRGQPVTLGVQIQTSDFRPGEGEAYVRGDQGGKFTQLRFCGGCGGVKVPDKFLTGKFFEDYVIGRDPATDRSLTVPPAGAKAPYRTFILNKPPSLSLGVHQFGHLRQPGAIVARAAEGTGPDEVGVSCEHPEDCAFPWSFDVGPDGSVWVVDLANGRIQGWTPGHPEKPSRRIPVSFIPLDVTVGPDGTVYVSGHEQGGSTLHLAVWAYTPSGHLKWMARILSEIANDHIRVGPSGVLYDIGGFGWAPVTDAGGNPLSLVDQRRLVKPFQPVSDSVQLVISALHGFEPAKDWGVALATSESIQRLWRVTSKDSSGIDPYTNVIPAVVGGDPVLMFAVFDFKKHLFEYEVVRLSSTGGIRERFSLSGRAAFGDLIITGLRVGYDGKLYQLRSSPDFGVRIARYSLASPSV